MMTDSTAPLDGYVTDITRHSEGTLFKVRDALSSVGLTSPAITDAIGAMQNEGILFRERVPEERGGSGA